MRRIAASKPASQPALQTGETRHEQNCQRHMKSPRSAARPDPSHPSPISRVPAIPPNSPCLSRPDATTLFSPGRAPPLFYACLPAQRVTSLRESASWNQQSPDVSSLYLYNAHLYSNGLSSQNKLPPLLRAGRERKEALRLDKTNFIATTELCPTRTFGISILLTLLWYVPGFPAICHNFRCHPSRFDPGHVLVSTRERYGECRGRASEEEVRVGSSSTTARCGW